MDIDDARSPSPIQILHDSSPDWDDDQMNASFANQSMEVNTPTSPHSESVSTSPSSQTPPPLPSPTTSQSKGALETPKINCLKHKHPFQMFKDINESVQHVKVETVDMQARSKLEREKLQVSSEKEQEI
jgi:hypothetical protein